MEKISTYLSSADDLFNYVRRCSSTVRVGNIEVGGRNPIRVQSMANTNTNDTDASISQCIRIIKAGGEIVRFTAQGVREAENLKNIREGLTKQGYNTPLVADIHFNPNAADVAARHVEKVRINPGNFVDSVHTMRRFQYTDDEYKREIEKIKERLIPFLNICKEHKTAVRIGVNHGSLSDRILSRYGDTPNGMVESCMEFLRICKAEDFNDVVISIKASNTVIMVQTVRLLVQTMRKEGMAYPLHLGVTEAGDGEDGRIKSAVGIGALLSDGIGDTIRVSLSEEPECEIPVAKALVDYITEREGHPHIDGEDSGKVNPYAYSRRKTNSIKNIGGDNSPVVCSKEGDFSDLKPDLTFPQNGFIEMNYSQLKERIGEIKETDILVASPTSTNKVGELRAFFHLLLRKNLLNPVVIKLSYNEADVSRLQLKAAADAGALLIDGLGDGLWIDEPHTSAADLTNIAFAILQAARVRISKTEFISCPSCGRTMFDLQTTIARIKSKTSHLKGLKIGIMGCIVNGPGEMADADYGYVGSAKDKVNLYKGQTCVEKLVPQEEAVDRLIALIKANGDWHEPK